MDKQDPFDPQRDKELDRLLQEARALIGPDPAPKAAQQAPPAPKAPGETPSEAPKAPAPELEKTPEPEPPAAENLEQTRKFQPVTDKPAPKPPAQPPAQPPVQPSAPKPASPSNTPEPDPEPEEEAHSYLWTSTQAARYVLGVLALSVLLAIGIWLAADDVFALTSEDVTATVTVTQGEDLADVAQSLQDAGLIRYKGLFRLYGRLFHADSKIAPGEYTLSAVYDYRALVVGMMQTYHARQTVTVTIPEGYTLAQIFDLLEQSGVASAEALTEAAGSRVFDYDFLAGQDEGTAARLEGYLFPDTYEFYLEDDPETVINKFLSNFETKFTADLYTQLDTLNARLQAVAERKNADFTPLTLRDVLTVASMIEKEAYISAERTTIASVIYNRLTDPNYPLLCIDATVRYALDQWTRELTYADLEVDSPYNTYLHTGLPQGPICSPGSSCIKAALYPSDTNYYFYALDTGGAHHFSETAAEHQLFLDEQTAQGG